MPEIDENSEAQNRVQLKRAVGTIHIQSGCGVPQTVMLYHMRCKKSSATDASNHRIDDFINQDITDRNRLTAAVTLPVIGTPPTPGVPFQAIPGIHERGFRPDTKGHLGKYYTMVAAKKIILNPGDAKKIDIPLQCNGKFLRYAQLDEETTGKFASTDAASLKAFHIGGYTDVVTIVNWSNVLGTTTDATTTGINTENWTFATAILKTETFYRVRPVPVKNYPLLSMRLYSEGLPTSNNPYNSTANNAVAPFDPFRTSMFILGDENTNRETLKTL